MKITICSSSLLLILYFASALNTSGQQTIFNVPSSDILSKGKVYAELDATFKPNDDDASRKFLSLAPRIVVGVGRNFEVGLNLAGNVHPGPDSTTFVPAVKWRPYNNLENGWAIVVGDNVFIPVRNRSYRIGNYAYAQVSRTFKTGARLTAGAYHFTKNVVASNAGRAGGQFSFELPINKFLNVNADWYTGNHAAGYFTPGIAFKPHSKVTGYLGYSIGNANAANGNHFVFAAIGINLN